MAVRRPVADEDISLFPFLSIIACVIGILTLMIATSTLSQMDTKDIALIEAYENTSQALKAEEERVAKLKKLLDEKIGPVAAQMRQQLDLSQKELDQLLKQLEQTHAELEKQQQVKIVIPTLDPSKRESVAAMQQQMASLSAEVAQMEKDLSGRKEASESKVSILPSGSGADFKPHFIECAEGALVLHDFNPPKTIRTADMVKDQDFLGVLEKVANNFTDTVIFLIRSDGLNTYNAARKLCTERSIRNGKLPVVGGGKIDLSRFAEPSK